MAKEEQLRQALKELMGKTTTNGVVVEGEVKSVDWDKRTCEVDLGDGRVLPAVRLKSIVDDSDSGIAIKPKNGSVVLVATVGEETEQFVCAFNEIESIELKMQDVELVIDGGKVKLKAKEIELNEGNNNGLVILQKAVNNFNEIKMYLNAFKNAVSAGLSGVGESTAASGSAGKGVFEATIASAQINFEDMENTKVKH